MGTRRSKEIAGSAVKSPLDIRKLEPGGFPQWDALVRSAPAGTVYHESRWLTTVCDAVGDALVILGAFVEGQLAAGVPLQVRRRGPIRIARRAFATPYSGILVHPDCTADEPHVVAEMMDALARRFSRVVLTDAPFHDVTGAQKGWQTREKATYLLDISEPDQVWSAFVAELRTIVRKAQSHDIQVRRTTDWGAFFILYRDTFARQGLQIPFNQDTFSRMMSQVLETGIGHAYMASLPGGTPCAAGLMLYDSRRAYYSLAGSDPQLRTTGASSLLLWETIQDLSEEHREFDLGGANVPSIRQFKSQFRGRLVNYSEAIHYRTYPEKVLLILYESLRRGAG